ncbi:MAG: BamA/TamA family outer membrane protein [Candidatus Zixiibacteriota bacterium]
MRLFVTRLCRCFGVLMLLLLAGTASAQYTEYKDTSSKKLLFEIFFNEQFFGYTVGDQTDETATLLPLTELEIRSNGVRFKGKTVIDSGGLHTDQQILPFDSATDIEVSKRKNYTRISFYLREGASSRPGRIRQGNRFTLFEPMTVGHDDFVRGSIFSVTGDIHIGGEVSNNVVSLFGNIDVGPGAVIRGDAVTVTGRVDLSGSASVYGEVRSNKDGAMGRRHRFSRFQSTYEKYFRVDLDAAMTQYNRVDGLSVAPMCRFADPDSVLPVLWVGGGYAFESRRWRYRFGAEQTILRNPAFSVGGELFRVLASDDDWLISNEENSAFAMVIGEDYKDWYEAQGAHAYLRSRPVPDLHVEAGFRYEETRWFEATQQLWSLFGGNKRFRDNFSQVEVPLREAGAVAIDTSTNYSWYLQAAFDTRDDDDPYRFSAWVADAWLEQSSPSLESDFDFARFRLSAARYQKIHRRVMAVMRLVYGGSGGELPMHRRFYLGGLGTMYGYHQKQYSGSRFWLANFEYRIDFPRSDFAASLLWDVGRIGENARFGDSEIKHSLGAAIYIGNDFKVGLARRLDRSYDNDPRFFARLTLSI